MTKDVITLPTLQPSALRTIVRVSLEVRFLNFSFQFFIGCTICLLNPRPYVHTFHLTRHEEDCGAGDSIDRCLASATGNALKGAVTDAMKRAARHFGEKLGNSLYHDGFNANNAPSTLKDALDTLDIDRAKSRFGFEKDAQKAGQTGQSSGAVQPVASNSSNPPASTNTTQPAFANQEQTKPTNRATNSSKPYAQPTPRTQYVGNVVMEHSKMLHTATTNIAKPPHVTPHHGPGNNVATKPTNTYATPANRSAAATHANTNSAFNLSGFAAIPAEELGHHGGKENANPLCHPAEIGLALPPRPGTSRGSPDDSPTSAYIANYSDSIGSTPSMFGANGSISQALSNEQSKPTIAQSLKRKSECLSASSVARPANGGTKNPYNC
jgi:DNA repair and recombination protein RAD52